MYGSGYVEVVFVVYGYVDCVVVVLEVCEDG